MAGGWNKFHSKILDWRWYTDGNTFRLFFHLIMTASYKDKPWHNIVIKRGQRIASYDSLAEELQLSQRQIRTALEHLKSTGEVTSKTTSKYSIITVVNYGTYQDKYGEEEEVVDKQATSKTTSKVTGKRQTSDKQATTSTDYTDSTEHTEEQKITPLPPSEIIPYQEITDAYNSTCTGLPKVKALTDLRRRTIRARWNMNKPDPLSHFKELFTKAGKSDFLNGINDRAWIADFDWLMKEQNAAKVLEGKYDNSAKLRASPGVNGGGQWPMTIAERNAASRDRSLKNIADYLKQEEQKNAGRNAGNETGDWESLGAGHNLLPGQD